MDTKVFERFCSESIFLLILLTFCSLIYRCKNYKVIKIYLIAYIGVLCILSYKFKPTIVLDLQRLKEEIKVGFNYDVSKLIQYIPKTSNYSKLVYFYIIKQIGDLDFLQTIVTGITYSCIFYTIYDYSKKSNFTGKEISKAVLLFIIFGQYIDLISGIRSTTAFALFYFCVYKEIIKGKSIIINIPIYIVAIGFHNSVVPAIAIRLAYLGLSKEKGIVKKILNIIMIVVFCVFTMEYGVFIIDSTLKKATTYLNKNVFISYFDYIVSAIVFVMCAFLFYVNIKNKKMIQEDDIVKKNYMKILVCYYCITLLFSYEYNIFHRYTILLSMLNIPMSLQAIKIMSKKKENDSKLIITTYSAIFYILLITISLVSFSKGEMSLLNYF